MDAPDKVTEIEIEFLKGDPIALNGKKLSPATMLAALNDLGRDNGIGRLDLVENRFVGMKSRGVYETPGGAILIVAHRAIESITLDRGAGHLKDEFMPRYAELIYNGFWFSPERLMLQAMIDKSQEDVEGTVRLKLYKGNVIVTGRKSKKTLYSDKLVTFEDDQGAYDQDDAAGFIRLNGLRLRALAARNRSTSPCTVLAWFRLSSWRRGHGRGFRPRLARPSRADRMQGRPVGLYWLCAFGWPVIPARRARLAGKRCRRAMPSCVSINCPLRSTSSAARRGQSSLPRQGRWRCLTALPLLTSPAS